jgi:hypothetical protein
LGSDKTTLAHQVWFANATPDRPALDFTVLGEPALKMLRYQQQFQFFDPRESRHRHPLHQPERVRGSPARRTHLMMNDTTL